MEGDPHPGAIVGRMPFQSFNPSIDKLNEEASNVCRPDAPGGGTLSRWDAYLLSDFLSLNWDNENGYASEAANCSKVSKDNGDLKRKQSDIDSKPQYPNKSPKNGHGVQLSPTTSKVSSKKQPKREKLNWNVLRPPKSNR
ncbi:hypothetical protein CRYUN_Cryun25bG0028800 [Craigia yunnanensis]